MVFFNMTGGKQKIEKITVNPEINIKIHINLEINLENKKQQKNEIRNCYLKINKKPKILF